MTNNIIKEAYLRTCLLYRITNNWFETKSTKTSASVTVIWSDGLGVQNYEVFIAGVRHKGEKERKEK